MGGVGECLETQKGSVLKIRFLPDGGFSKSGAFIEYEGDAPEGDEPQYERDFPTLEILCNAMEIKTSAVIISEDDEPENPDRSVGRVIAGKGVIQPARFRSFSLSFLGKRKTHHEVSITILQRERREEISFAGMYFEAGYDTRGADEFFLQIEVHPSRFTTLLSELSEPHSMLRALVDVGAFPNFFTTWSPVNGEGRVIKYLNYKSDVANQEEVPESFWLLEEERKGLRSRKGSAPVTVVVSRPLRSISGAAEDHNAPDVGDEQQPYDFAAQSPLDNWEQALLIERNNALRAQVGLTEAFIKQIRGIGRWTVACLIVLIIAVITK